MNDRSDVPASCREEIKRLIKRKHDPHRRIADMCARLLISTAEYDHGALRGLLTEYFKGKTVLVTGAGGSVGSELCRKAAMLKIKRLVMLDICENNAYELCMELNQRFRAHTECVVEIASIRDEKRLCELFSRHRPDIVLHAAAHKHVPLMEYAPCEAIKNNIFGTLNVMSAAKSSGAQRFILISTDKAVNPVSVMGATKRFCELLLHTADSEKTVFAAVRFGNVLGTSGSVLPLFERQIERGGPVTVTSKHAERYFMTVSQAAQLVLHAAVMAKQSQVMVLDMGLPVNIARLAETLITLHGKRPYEDIKIVETGLRPGEKLCEELLFYNGSLCGTCNSRIFTELAGTVNPDALSRSLKKLRRAVECGSDEQMKSVLMKAVSNDKKASV